MPKFHIALRFESYQQELYIPVQLVSMYDCFNDSIVIKRGY